MRFLSQRIGRSYTDPLPRFDWFHPWKRKCVSSWELVNTALRIHARTLAIMRSDTHRHTRKHAQSCVQVHARTHMRAHRHTRTQTRIHKLTRTWTHTYTGGGLFGRGTLAHCGRGGRCSFYSPLQPCRLSSTQNASHPHEQSVTYVATSLLVTSTSSPFTHTGLPPTLCLVVGSGACCSPILLTPKRTLESPALR